MVKGAYLALMVMVVLVGGTIVNEEIEEYQTSTLEKPLGSFLASTPPLELIVVKYKSSTPPLELVGFGARISVKASGGVYCRTRVSVFSSQTKERNYDGDCSGLSLPKPTLAFLGYQAMEGGKTHLVVRGVAAQPTMPHQAREVRHVDVANMNAAILYDSDVDVAAELAWEEGSKVESASYAISTSTDVAPKVKKLNPNGATYSAFSIQKRTSFTSKLQVPSTKELRELRRGVS